MTMETQVLDAKKEYNRLKTEWKAKKRALSSTNTVLSAKDIHLQEKSHMQRRVEDLERAVSQARDQLEQEELETRKLLHMKHLRMEHNTRYFRPLEELKSHFRAASTALEAAVQDTQALQALNRTSQAELQTQCQALALQKQRHTEALETRAQQYRDRRGFEEFRQRYKGQKLLLRTIASNEGNMREIYGKLQENVAAEANLASVAASESQLQQQERLLLTLKETTNVSEFGEIGDYWDYLQTNQQHLRATIEEQTAKIAALRQQFVAAKADFGELKWTGEPSASLSSDALEAAELRVKSSRSELATKHSEVLSTQLEAWQHYINRVTAALHQLCPHSSDLPIPQLCERVVQFLLESAPTLRK